MELCKNCVCSFSYVYRDSSGNLFKPTVNETGDTDYVKLLYLEKGGERSGSFYFTPRACVENASWRILFLNDR